MVLPGPQAAAMAGDRLHQHDRHRLAARIQHARPPAGATWRAMISGDWPSWLVVGRRAGNVSVLAPPMTGGVLRLPGIGSLIGVKLADPTGAGRPTFAACWS